MPSKPGPKYASGEDTTWYSRPPMMPNGMAQMAMSQTLPSGAPRLAQRTEVSQRPAMMPSRMHRA